MISKKERNLIKGAVRRIFSRSETRQAKIKDSIIKHSDPKRPRVTKWSKCETCGKAEASYKMEVDHIDPVVPINRSLEDMSWDEVISRIFCKKENLSVVCKVCHTVKTKDETRARAKARKDRKNV